MKDNRAYLLHMRDAIERVTRYTAEGQAAFLADTKTQDAVVRNLEIIGEAAKQLSEDLKTEHPGVPWRQSARRRRFFRHFCVAALHR